LIVILEAIIGPMTLNGDRGLFTQMRIQDPHSLDLVKNDLSAPNTEETRYVFELALRGGFLAKRRVKLRKISPAPSLPKRGISSFLQSLPAVGRGEKEGFNGLCCSLLSNYRKIEKIKWILGSPLSSIEDFDSNYPLIF
jgi:hypothetical protein